MVCYHPLSGFRISYKRKGVNDEVVKIYSSREEFERLSNKFPGLALRQTLRQYKISPFDVENVEVITAACQQCIGCRLDRSKQWAVRCVHEASLHEENCFLTLTYDDLHLPLNGSLIKKDLQDFWKRLRKFLGTERIRYYACGEYGSLLSRPHYHAIVFGYWPSDAKLFSFRSQTEYYISESLTRLWPFGFHQVTKVTFNTAAYVARYILKKINGNLKDEHYHGLEPEYTVMSRKPGIATDWFLKFHDDVYPHDYIVISDKIKCKPPRFYDNLYDLNFGDIELIKEARKAHKFLSIDELKRKEKYMEVNIKKRLKRNYEID